MARGPMGNTSMTGTPPTLSMNIDETTASTESIRRERIPLRCVDTNLAVSLAMLPHRRQTRQWAMTPELL